MSTFLYYLVSGILSITIIDTLGSIASRTLKFKYIWLMPLSIIVYITIGYYGSLYLPTSNVVIAGVLTGIYDGTVGLWLSLTLRANISEDTYEKQKQMLGITSAIFMAVVALIFTGIGVGIVKI